MAESATRAANRLRYTLAPDNEDEDCRKTFWLKTSLDRNLTSGLNFTIPADSTTFTDTNSTFLSVTLRVLHSDGSSLQEDDKVFLTHGTLQSLFSSVQIFLNGSPLEPSNAYSWSSTLTSYLGTSKAAREDVWSQLAGSGLPNFNSSFVRPEDGEYFGAAMRKVAGSREVTLTGRLMSDFMQSCAQLLPPGIKLQVVLTPSPDAFPIVSCSEDQSRRYKIEIRMASLFLRRVVMRPETVDRCRSSLSSGGHLAYTRLSVIVNQIPATGVSYRVGNLFGGGPLPHTLYLLLVNQKAYAGSQQYLANFFESGFVRSLQVYENGRPVLTQPIRTRYEYLEDGISINDRTSDATEPFLSVTQALNGIADSRIAVGLSYRDFVRGCIVSCVTLNSCGGVKTLPGFIDIEMELSDNIHRTPMLLLAFGEFSSSVKLDGALNVVAH